MDETELLRLDFQIYKRTGNRLLVFLFFLFCLFILFSECSYDVSANDRDNRVAREVTTSSAPRPQLGGAAIDFVVMWLDAPARPSFS